MNKFIFLIFTLVGLSLFCNVLDVNAVVAYPFPIEFKQPDGKLITITLKGDEKISWAETSDGYTLLSNGKNGWEYAEKDSNGNLKISGVLAHGIANRTLVEQKLIRGLAKGLRYSEEQVKMMISTWDKSIGSDKLIGGGSFFKPNLKGATLNKLKSAETFTPSGVKNLLMILIQFPDLPFHHGQSEFAGLMNVPGYSDNGAHGSVKDYFKEVSYGQFDLTTDVAPNIYTAAHNMAYYGADVTEADGYVNHSPKAAELMREAILAADADGVDFSKYDNDGDGSVDGVYVIFAGYSQASGGPSDALWAHAGTIAPALTCDGKSVSKYSCSNELTGGSGTEITTIGVICHEFGHVCGAPDYYDTDYSTNGEFPGTGKWDVMCYGVYNGNPGGSQPAHFNPYEKIRAGWIQPVTLTGATSCSIPDITTNKSVYIYNTATTNEYFLLENRQQTGFNASCPGHGMLIYKFSQSYWNSNANTKHPQGFYLVSANATTSPSAGISITSAAEITAAYGDVNAASAPFPGTGNKTSFTDNTTPSAKSWAGANTGYPLSNIAEASNLVTFCFNGCPAVNSIQSFAAVAAGSSQINLSWLNSANVIIARNTTNTFGSLVTGTAYSVGNTLSGGGEIVYIGTSSSFSNTGLSASTTYYYQIWATDGSANYSLPSAANAITTCASTAQALFSEGFEGGTIPSCWTQEYVSNSYNWSIATKSGYASTPALAHGGTKLALFYDGAWKSPVSKLITPPLDLSGAASPVLKFWHTQAASNANQDALYVYYRTSVTDSWKLLQSYTGNISNWTLETISLPSVSSTYYIAFEGHASNGCGICLDDMEVWKAGGTNKWIGVTSTDWFTASNWSAGVVPTSTNDVEIQSETPYSPAIATSGALCQNITIDTGATITMGTSATNDLTIGGNLIINGILNATTALSTINIAGNWENNGTFNYGTSSAGSLVNFNGTNSLQTIGGTATTNFYTIKVNKGSLNNILEVVSPITLKAAVSTSTPVSFVKGTLKISNASTTITPFNNPGFWSDYGLWNNGGTINIAGVYLAGTLRNTAGTTTIGSCRLYNSTSQTPIIIEGGTLNITDYLGPYSSSDSYKANYTQTGGTVTINSASATIPFYLNSGSTFNMSGGSIVIQKKSGNASADYQNLASTYNVTGGTLQIGNESTSTNQIIGIASTAPIHNLVVNSKNSPTAKLVTNGLTVNNDVTISSGAKIDLNSQNLQIGGNWTNNGEPILGTSAGTVTFNGTSAQSIGGSVGTTFNDLVVDTESGVTTENGITTVVNGNLIINTEKKLTVAPGSSLTVSNLVNNSGTTGLVIKSDATSAGSVIAGTTTATATFESYLTGNKWHVVTPPVSGETVSSFIQNSANGIPSKDVSGTLNYGMMSYNEAGNLWNSYYTATTTDVLNSGQGYGLRNSANGIMSYVGAITSGSKTVSLTKLGEGWNCIGNPYTSAIKLNEAAGAVNNFLTTNAASLDDSYACIYVWDESYKGYKILGNSPAATTERILDQNIFQSGQGFFVKAKTAGSQVTFNPQMQLHSSNVQLKSASQSWPGFALAVQNGELKASTVIAFNSQMTKGLDPTYDAGLLRGSSGLEVFSRLVDDNGIDFAVQCLPDVDFNKLVIPIGVESKLGGTLVFGVDARNLPNGCSVILEDKLAKKFTDLTTSNYRTTVEPGISGNSRFQIHTSYLTTAIKDGDFDGVKKLAAYAVSNTEIRIQGSVNAGAKASLIDVAGRIILTDNLEEGELNVIHCQPLIMGVYLLLVKDNGADKVFKIITKE